MCGSPGDREEDTISNRIFVGNLNYQTTQSELEALFTEAGELVEVFLPVDRDTGRPRGFAFVEFADQDAVATAIEKFDGHDMGGRNLRVNIAEERRPRTPSPPSGGWGQPDAPRNSWGAAKPKGSRRNIRGRKRSL